MQKANQQALLQSTNVGLLAIRQIELNYYAGFYTVFGSQAAILGGLFPLAEKYDWEDGTVSTFHHIRVNIKVGICLRKTH